MGGHQDGNYASRLITDVFENIDISGDLEQKIELSLYALSRAHNALLNRSARLGEGVIIGATVALLLADGKVGACIYAGDSRCYALRSDKLLIATEDHIKFLESPEGGRKYLTKALCVPSKFDMDVKRFAIENGDTFLLCTDGFYDGLTTAAIKNAMRSSDMNKALSELGDVILAKNAEDNLTAVMARIEW
jgi:serine/threonine protein phosphatase PrpC